MRRIALILLLLLLPLAVSAQRISSPDGRFQVAVGNDMTYTVSFKGKEIVQQSQLGVDIDNRLFESALGVPRGEHENWCGDLKLKGEERTTVDTTWTPLYGENAQIRNHYNQLVLHYEKGSQDGAVEGAYDKRKYYAMDIVVRAYNEGIAFRYHFPETANSLFLHITGEQTSFRMPKGTMAWYEEWAQGPYQRRSLRSNPSRNGGEEAGAVTLFQQSREEYQGSSVSDGSRLLLTLAVPFLVRQSLSQRLGQRRTEILEGLPDSVRREHSPRRPARRVHHSGPS